MNRVRLRCPKCNNEIGEIRIFLTFANPSSLFSIECSCGETLLVFEDIQNVLFNIWEENRGDTDGNTTTTSS